MSVNKVFIVGRLTKDAEIREVGQNRVARFSVATSEKYRKSNGEYEEETEFHDITLWGSEGIHKYLTKGRQVCVEGSIKTEKWTANDGTERRRTTIRAHRVDLLSDGRKDEGTARPSIDPVDDLPI